MQDIYAFDVGDFGKIGLLRSVCSSPLRLGVLWWKTQLGSGGLDGKHVRYLADRRFRAADSMLWDEMGRILREEGTRSIRALEPLFPRGTAFHDRPVPLRQVDRNNWFNEAMKAVEGVDVVFCDPDNGIHFDDSCRSLRHVSALELRQLFDAGHSLVVYHHLNRSAPHSEQIKVGLSRLSEVSGGAPSWAAHFRRGSSRVLFVLAQSRHADVMATRLSRMKDSAWARDGHFNVLAATHFRET